MIYFGRDDGFGLAATFKFSSSLTILSQQQHFVRSDFIEHINPSL